MSDYREVTTYKFVKEFSCIGADCEDSCCSHSWNIAVGKQTKEKYEKKNPELLDFMDLEKDLYAKMDEGEDCKAFTKGICIIHKNHGADYLSDTCYFYPRVVRDFGSSKYMMTHLSCPEVVRKILDCKDAFEETKIKLEREPVRPTKILPEDGESEDSTLVIYNNFLEFADNKDKSCEQILLDIANVAFSMNNIMKKDWVGASKFLLDTVDERPIVNIEKKDDDIFKLLMMFHIETVKKSDKLNEVLEVVSKAIGVEFLNEKGAISYKNVSGKLFNNKKNLWMKHAEDWFDPIFRKLLKSQLIFLAFPFAGGDKNIIQKTLSMIIRFALIKMFLICYVKDDGTPPTREEIVKVIYVISRALEHITEHKVIRMNCEEAGWHLESRLAGLLSIFCPNKIASMIEA